MTETFEFAEFWTDLLESPAIREMLQESLSETRMGEKIPLTSSDRIEVLGQRILLELLAARVLQSQESIELDEALDRLGQELDVDCLAIAPKYEPLKRQLSVVLSDLDVTAQSVLDFLERGGRARDSRWAGYLPVWLTESLVSLAIPEKPVLFLNCSNSTLVPRFLLSWSLSKEQELEFVTLDRDPKVVENLRLLVFLVLNDPGRVRESVLLHEEGAPSFEKWGFSQLNLFDTFEVGTASFDLQDIVSSELGSRKFGSAIVSIQGPAFQSPRYYAELSQTLPDLLAQTLTIDGRAIIMGPPSLLDGTIWSKFRANSREHLHVESIIDFVVIQTTLKGFEPIFPTLISLRQPQQSIARQVTVFAPAEPDYRAFEPNELLDGVVAYLNNDVPPQAAVAFERPTSEVDVRWDPKFYCPARRELQDELINSPQAMWLGAVTQLIGRGPLPSILRPYITARIAGATLKEQQETIAHLKAGDQVWLQRETDHPHDPNAVHVRRALSIWDKLPERLRRPAQ